MKNKRKSWVLAFILGVVIGPLGVIYFGFRVLLGSIVALVISFLAATLVTWIFQLEVPSWLYWVWFAFFPISNLFLTFFWNGAISNSDGELTRSERTEFAALVAAAMGRWEFRIVTGSAIIATIVSLISQRRWGAAILALIFLGVGVSWLSNLMGMLATFVVGIVAALVAMRADAKERRVTRKAPPPGGPPSAEF